MITSAAAKGTWCSGRVVRRPSGRWTRFAGGVAGVALTVALPLSGCSIVKAVKAIAQANAAMNKFLAQLKNQPKTYEITYVTTGSSPTTVVIAAQPPNNLAFITSGTGSGGATQVIENSTGSYSCSQSGGGGGSSGSTGSAGSGAGQGWSCLKFGRNQAAQYTGLFQLYTSGYWYGALSIYAGAAALVGVSVKSTTMTVNGFNLQCIVIGDKTSNSGSGQLTGTWCNTSQGFFGYAAASGSTAFEIKSFTASPPASVFQLPAGAKVTTLPGSSGSSGASSTTGGTGSTSST